jgi:hypothetical protein
MSAATEPHGFYLQVVFHAAGIILACVVAAGSCQAVYILLLVLPLLPLVGC